MATPETVTRQQLEQMPAGREMDMSPPIRIQRRRTRGFNLQAQSPDGRPVVSVCRPGRWGNPFKIGEYASMGGVKGCCWALSGRRATAPAQQGNGLLAIRKQAYVSDAATAADQYRRWLGIWQPDLSELRGKHLACYCKPGEPCHADVLLELANPVAAPTPQEEKAP